MPTENQQMEFPHFPSRACSLIRSSKKPEALWIPDTLQHAKSQELERLFHYLDEDGDGKISPAELRSSVRTVGGELSLEDAEVVVESVDSDGDGLLALDDLLRLVGDHEQELEEARERNLREAFKIYEMEGQGCITPKSLNRVLSRLGESKTIQECAAMIRRFDIDGDGVISFDEFLVMML